MVYHHPKYHPIPQIKSPSSFIEAASHNHLHQFLFLCPNARGRKDVPEEFANNFPLNSSSEYVLSTTRVSNHHHVLPLFWCNNEKFNARGGCSICYDSNYGTDYYFCDYCQTTFHKECVQSPIKIKHPYHPEHSLQLYYFYSLHAQCLYCGKRARALVYHCSICQAFMHPICAMRLISFVIDKPKSHDHPLTFFPRQTSLTCNVCGLVRKKFPTYVCLRCNFVAHNDCMYSPYIIKISRHHHRISYVSSLQSGKWLCGVCRQNIIGCYGAYACDKCGDYAIHSRCALGKDVWDGEELKGVPEEDDITQDAPPFDMISEGLLHYFLHDHHLRLEDNILYNENKLCQACVLPIFEGDLYSCMECEFTLHETCLKAHRRIQHALHPHPLTLKAVSRYDYGVFRCSACERDCGGFVYQCPVKECEFDLDVQCASVCEPFDYQGHEHPLFLSLDPKEKPICEICKSECKKPLNCIKCNFIVCIKCVTLPYKARYKHDKHFLTVSWGKEVCENYWCEECEHNLRDTSTKLFYWCNDCCTTLHIACLLSEDPYMRPGQFFKLSGREIQILGKSNISRPICVYCKNTCQGKRFISDNRPVCSIRCAYEIS